VQPVQTPRQWSLLPIESPDTALESLRQYEHYNVIHWGEKNRSQRVKKFLSDTEQNKFIKLCVVTAQAKGDDHGSLSRLNVKRQEEEEPG
jgi:hypothetical protein